MIYSVFSLRQKLGVFHLFANRIFLYIFAKKKRKEKKVYPYIRIQ